MTSAEKAISALTDWLGQETGFSHVRQLVYRYAGTRIRQGALGVYLTHRFGPSSEELLDETAQEFLQFLLQDFLPKLKSHPDQVNAILNGQAGKVVRFALERFFWRLQDAARKKDNNPRAYLHRRIRDVLGQDERFILHKDKQNTLSFSAAPCNHKPGKEPNPWPAVEYGRWRTPPAIESRDTVFTTKYLSEAALFFLQEACRHLPAGTAIPIREMVRYLAVHFPWLNRLHAESFTEDLTSASESKTMEERFSRIAALDSISALAVHFSLNMDETSKKIFYLALGDPPLSFREIAERLELPNHNHPYRIHRKTIDALKNFTSTWPGPPLSELPEEIGPAFLEELRKICKMSTK